jgi:hypothetical protein
MIDKKFIQEYSRRYQQGYLAKNYALEQEIKAEMKGNPACMSKELLFKVLRWKAARASHHVKHNQSDFVKEITRDCFLCRDEKHRIEVLKKLRGVSYRVASTILHFRFPHKYTIMDYRAWESLQDPRLTRGERVGFRLGKDYPIKDDFEHWMTYLSVCRNICKREKCSLRVLDKALWQYSKEKG